MRKVASYCRVSTDKADQANSFEAQQRYFTEYIGRIPEWELYEVYADEGITGTSTKKRTQFHRMIHDAYAGKFQLVITKEVSRFSRNILDTITYTRELKALGIGVLFMTDGINTMDPDAELRLSIMASLAQEESRKTSSRVKWGQTRQMERGVVFGRSLLGYDVVDGQIRIEPEGAALVQKIFHMYAVEKKGSNTIARELQKAGYRTSRGNTKWTGSQVIKILKNEKYIGMLIQKKTITPNYLTHEKKYNHGEEELVIIENHHEPIVDRQLWEMACEERARRNRHGDPGVGHSNRYVFSGRIKCGECGSGFVGRKKYRKDGSSYRRWMCLKAVTEGGTHHVDAQGNTVGCDVGWLLRDDIAMDVLQRALASLRMDTAGIIRNVTALAVEAIKAGEQSDGHVSEKLKHEIAQIEKKKAHVLDAFFAQDITRDEMRRMREMYDRQLTEVNHKLDAALSREEKSGNANQLYNDVRRQIEDIVSGQKESEIFYKTVLDHMVAYQDHRVEVRLNHLPQKWLFTV